MHVRTVASHAHGSSSTFNMSTIGEVIVTFNDGDADTMFTYDLEVELPTGLGKTWKNLHDAFRDHDVVPNNENTSFGLPLTNECKVRGYNP